jgi:TolA-binding protein
LRPTAWLRDGFGDNEREHKRGLRVASAISKEEIRRNPLAEWLGAVVRFVQARRRAARTVLVVLVIGAAGGGGYWWYQQREEEEASRLLSKAYAALKSDQRGSPGKPEEAIKGFQGVIEQFPGTRSAEEALIALGNLEYDSGKMREALATFDRYLSAFPRGRFRVMAALGKAYAQETTGDIDGAAKTLSQLLEHDKDDPLTGEAYTSLGRLYEEAKKPDDALRVYEKVIETYPQTRWAQNAVQRMSALRSR